MSSLRELIRVRPCVSLIDYQAKRAVTGRCAIEAPTPFCGEAGHA
jgi:hypothetical protein